jgi:uncharacterized protein YqjF (DUF2071 family)
VGRAAAFVAAGDSRGLAEALEQLITEETERGRLSSLALARPRAYTVEHTARTHRCTNAREAERLVASTVRQRRRCPWAAAPRNARRARSR